MSRITYSPKPPVCVESTAVGRATASAPKAEIIGSATLSEHLPIQDRSFINAARFIPVPFMSVISCSSS